MLKHKIGIVAAVLLSSAVASAAPFVVKESFTPAAPFVAPVLHLTRAEKAPVIDGDLSDPVWKTAAHVPALIELPHTWVYLPFTEKTQAWVTYDNENLYVAFECMERLVPEMYDEPGAEPVPYNWAGVILDPDFSRRDSYQLNANSLGSVSATTSLAQHGGWKPTWHTAGKRLNDRWTLEMAIPFASLGSQAPKPGQSWGFDLLRQRVLWKDPANHRDSSWYKRGCQRSVWSPTPGGFGSPQFAGTIVFGTPEEQRARVIAPALSLCMDRAAYSKLDGRGSVVLNLTPGTYAPKDLAATVSFVKEGQTEPAAKFVVPSFQETFCEFSVDLNALGGDYSMAAELKGPGGEVFSRRTWSFTKEAGDWHSAESKTTRVPLKVPATPTLTATDVPITTGVPLPKGALFDAAHVRVVDDAGKEVPSQTIVRSRWHEPDGSIRWLGLDFTAHVTPGKDAAYSLEFGTDVAPERIDSPLRVEENAERLLVTTGPAQFEISKKSFVGIRRAWVANEAGVLVAVPEAANARGSYVVDEAGRLYTSALDANVQVTVEESGPQRVCICAKGWHVAQGADAARMNQFVMRIYAYAGQPYVRVFHTFIITADTLKVRFADIGLDMPVAVGAGDGYRFGGAQLIVKKTTDVYPDFPGTKEDRQTVVQAVPGRDKVITGQLRPGGDAYLVQTTPDEFHLRTLAAGDTVGTSVTGSRSAGWFRVDHGVVGVTAMLRDAWQNYPKEFEIAPDRMTVHFWPAHGEPGPQLDPKDPFADASRMWFCHSGKLLDFNVPDAFFKACPVVAFLDDPVEYLKKFKIPGGLDAWSQSIGASKGANAIGTAKTHELLLYFHTATLPDEAVSNLAGLHQEFPHAMADPMWVCNSGVIGPQWPVDKKRFGRIEAAVEQNIKGMLRIQDLMNTYGMWNYGDCYTSIDRAALRPAIYRMYNHTHYFTADDPWLMYMRSGDPFYLGWARASTQHVSDIDYCHYYDANIERRTRVGGCSHCKYYVHWRNHNEAVGHNVETYFMLYAYFLEGNRRALDVYKEWAGACKEVQVPGDDGRESVNDIYNMVGAYTELHDAEFLPKIWATFPIQAFPEAWARFWSPHLVAVHMMTGDPRALAMMTGRLDKAIADKEDVGDNELAEDAYASMVTGDKKYVSRGTAAVGQRVQRIESAGRELRDQGKLSCLDGVIAGGDVWLATSFMIHRYGYLLRAMTEANVDVDWMVTPPRGRRR